MLNCSGVVDVYASAVMKTVMCKQWWSVVIMSSGPDARQQCLRQSPAWVEHCNLSGNDVSHDVMSAQFSRVGLFDEPKIS